MALISVLQNTCQWKIYQFFPFEWVLMQFFLNFLFSDRIFYKIENNHAFLMKKSSDYEDIHRFWSGKTEMCAAPRRSAQWWISTKQLLLVPRDRKVRTRAPPPSLRCVLLKTVLVLRLAAREWQQKRSGTAARHVFIHVMPSRKNHATNFRL